MNTLVEMINSMEVREDDETFKNAVDYMFDGLERRSPQHFAVRQYKKYKLASGKTAKSILISCGARLAPFDIPQLREIMSYDELELDKLGDEKSALFFLISDTDTTYNFLVTTKNNNTFYIVIDRSATSQNVYMLSQIDENDLSEFLDKDSTATVVTPQPDTSKVVLDETNNEDVDKEATVDPEKTASTKTNMGVMATILILALGGVAAYYYFKIYKPKKEEDEDDQPEGLE